MPEQKGGVKIPDEIVNAVRRLLCSLEEHGGLRYAIYEDEGWQAQVPCSKCGEWTREWFLYCEHCQKPHQVKDD